jgi:hypothetical protein
MALDVPRHLVTPRDWAAIKRTQATDLLGSFEARELLADAKKLDVCADLIWELEQEIAALRKMLATVPVDVKV